MVGRKEAAREIWDTALQTTPDDEMLLEVIETLEDARRRHQLHTNTVVSLHRAIAHISTVVGRLERKQVKSVKLKREASNV